MRNVRCTATGFQLDDTKTFCPRGARPAGGVDDSDAWRDGAPLVERGRVGVAELRIAAGDEVVWSGVQGCEPLAPLDVEAGWASAAEHWTRCWDAAFTPGNDEFSGFLRFVDGPGWPGSAR